MKDDELQEHWQEMAISRIDKTHEIRVADRESEFLVVCDRSMFFCSRFKGVCGSSEQPTIPVPACGFPELANEQPGIASGTELVVNLATTGPTRKPVSPVA